MSWTIKLKQLSTFESKLLMSWTIKLKLLSTFESKLFKLLLKYWMNYQYLYLNYLHHLLIHLTRSNC